MPKSTVTVDSGNNFAYPAKLDIVKANGLVTVDSRNNFAYPAKLDIVSANGLVTKDNIQDKIKELRLPKLTFECTTDDDTNTKYQVELKVSIVSDGVNLIPQVELGIPERLENEE